MTTTHETGPGPALSALLSEMDDLREMAEERGGEVAADLLGLLSVGALLETAPDNDTLIEEFHAAWHGVMKHEATTMVEVVMKCRATALYREGCKEWGSDTFCNDGYPYLQQMIGEGAELYVEMLNNR